MSKIFKILLPIIAVAIAAVSVVVVVFKEDPTYEIDATNFNTIVAYEDDVDLSGIKIIEKKKEEVTKEIPVDDTMVKSVDSTSSVGNNKSLVISYAGNDFSLAFSVKYKIEFIVDDKAINTQFVLNASEIIRPNDPKKTGYEFIGWNPEIPTAVNDNLELIAKFTDVPTSIPNLGSYEAEYGDTLSMFTLPSNSQGSWKFVDDGDTKVGEIGKNVFMVQFIPNNSELTVLKDEVVINVSKKKLEFKELVTEFKYDSLPHRPTFILDVEIPEDNIIYTGEDGTEVDSYFYAFKIVDPHYEGSCMGTFRIVSSFITIDIESPEPITFGDAIPEIKYTVTGIDDPSILGIKAVYPNVNRAGNFDLTVEIESEFKENFNIVINKGILVVNKANLEVTDPEVLTDPIYLNKLSTVEILNDSPNGYWEWVNPDLVFTSTGTFTYDMVFIPNSSNFNEIIKTVELTVLKKVVQIEIINNTYTYDGLPHQIEYKYVGVEEGVNVQVDGLIIETNAGNYPTTLQINDNNYTATIGTTLVINKAKPDKDFNIETQPIYVLNKLKDISLPTGYSWITGSTELLTAGENLEFEAKYTPEDTKNYETLYGKIKVDVLKRETAIYGVMESYTFDYDGKEKVLSDITTNPNDAELVYTYTLNGSPANRLYNAGTYTVDIEILENDFYLGTKVSTMVVISQAKDSKPQETIEAIYGDTLGMFKLPESSYGTWSWVEGDDAFVGDALVETTHVAQFISNDINYSNDTAVITFIIAKREVAFNNIVSTFTYDGTEKDAAYEFDNGLTLKVDIINVNNEADTGKRINADTYQFNYVINDANYKGSQIITLTINKAIPVTATDFANINPSVDWNTTLGAIELPQGYSFTDPSNTLVSIIGNNEFNAIYTPNDTLNYETVAGVIIVCANPILGSLDITNTIDNKLEYTYGDKYEITTSVNHTESTLEYKYYLNDVEVKAIDGVGSYKVVITLPESEHYLEAIKEITVVVEAKSVDVTWTNLESYTYNPNGQEVITAYYTDINGTKIYLDLVEENNQEFMNAGNYSYSVESKDSNYVLTDSTTKLDVEIVKATFDMTNVKWSYDENTSYIYNGATYTVILNNLPEGITAIYTDNSMVDAGDYTATVELEYDTDNYNLVDEIAGIDWSISKANATVSWETLTEYIYSGSEYQYPVATINSVLRATIGLTVELEGSEKFINAGQYTFKAIDESNNYNLSNDTCTITITPMSVDLDWENVSYTYTGSALDYPQASFIDASGDKIVITPTCDKEFITVGEYTFTAAYNDSNYTIEHSTLSKTYEILKAQYDMSKVEWSYKSAYTYAGNEYEIVVTGLPTGVSVIEYKENKATNVGTYNAVAVLSYDKDNYNELADLTISWEIKALSVAVTWTQNNYIYTGSVLTIPTATITDVNNNVIKLSVVEKNNLEFKEAGSYTFIASIEDTNYSLTNVEYNVTVSKNTVSQLSAISATYGDTLETISSKLPLSDFGTWSFAYDDISSVSVGTYGERDFNVKFTSNNENYESFESTVLVKVSKKELIITPTQTTFTYDGNEHIIIYELTGFVNGETAESISAVVTGVISGTNVSDSKTTTLALEACNNYYANSVNTKLTINKASTYIKNLIDINNTTYSGVKYVFASSNYEVVNENDEKISASINANAVRYGVVIDVINAGNYDVVVKATVNDPNYDNPENLTYSFEVLKAEPKLSYTGETEFTYGDIINITATTNTDNNGTISYVYYKFNDETGNYDEVKSIKSVGTYNVEVSISETSNYKSKSITIEGIVINKDSLDLTQLAEIKAIYGQTLSDFEFTQPENGTYTWVEDETTFVGDALANVTHQAKFTPNDLENYEVSYQDVKFIISQATLSIEIDTNTISYVYDETEKKVAYTVNGFKCNDTIEDVTVEVTSGTIKATNVGVYEFTLEIIGNSNYKGTVSSSLTILEGEPTYIIPTFEANYLDTYEDVAKVKNEGTEGYWTIVADLESSVGNAGTRNVTATFTPNNLNYSKVTLTTAILVVKQIACTPEVVPSNLTATYGDKLATVSLETSDTMGEWSWKDTSSTALVGNAGNATHIAVYIINSNYIPYEIELTINVSKAESIITNNIKQALVYTGNNQIEGLFSLNHTEAELEYTITKDGDSSSLINAGTYKIEVFVEATDNYNAAALTVEEVVINKANPVTEDDFADIECVTTYGEKLSVFTNLPEGFEFINPNTILSTIGENLAYPAKYTPSDKDNYNSVNGTIYVTVNKIIGTITASNQTFVYNINNTTGFEIEATTNNKDSDAVITYKVNGISIEDNPIINAGIYSVEIIVSETTHFTAATKTITVTVEKAKEEIIVADTISYGSTLEDVTANTSDYGTIVITDTNPEAAVSLAALEEDFLGVADEVVTLYVIFTPYEEYANNFAAFVKEIQITIVKKELTFTNVVNTYTYDGSEHTITYELTGFVDSKTTSNINVLGNVVATTVAQSISLVTLEINDSNYYGTFETSLIINKANPVTADDFANINIETNWNTTLNDVVSQLPSGYAFKSVLSTSVGEVGNNTFEAIYTPVDTDNYNIISGVVSVKVNRLATVLTVSSYSNLTYIPNKTYNVTASVNHNEQTDITITITYNGTELVDVLSNAGTYTIVVEASESKHYAYKKVETTVEIAQATPTTDFTDVFTVKWTDTLTLADITLDSNYAWADSQVALDNIESKTYKAIYTPTDKVNYKTVEGYFTVNVIKSDATITSDAVYTFEYTGSPITLTNVNPSHNESTVIYTVNSETVNLVGIGTYNVVIILPESAHYNKATCNATVTIIKANVKFTVDSYNATYLDTLGSLTLPTSEYGTWAWVTGDDTLVGDAGTQIHQAHFTPYDSYLDCYNEVTLGVTINVAQIPTVVTDNIPTDIVYDGTTYITKDWFTLSHTYGSLFVTPAEITDAGIYTITVSLPETKNVEGYNKQFTVEIAPKPYQVTSIPTASATYGDSLSTVELVGGDNTGTWTWVSSTEMINKAPTQTYMAKFTPDDSNLAISTHQIEITVSKKTIKFINILNQFDYNGNLQVIGYDFEGVIEGDAKPTVSGNIGLTDVGSQEFTLIVVSDYYQGTTNQTLTINAATPNLTLTALSTYEDRADIEVPNHMNNSDKVYATLGDTSTRVQGVFTYDSSSIYYKENINTETYTLSMDVTFTPTGDGAHNYKSTTKAISITLTAVAKNGTYHFGTVEKALAATTSGTVTVIVGTNPVIKAENLIDNTATVFTGVTLFIPHTTGASVKGSDGGKAEYYSNTTMNDAKTEYIYTYDNPSVDSNKVLGTYDAAYFATSVQSRLKNTLTISEGVVLKNYGTIEISGQLSGAGGGAYAAGHTYGYYTRILLEANAQIFSTGTINCYGYIDEADKNNGSKITIDSGAIYMPYVLRDFRGGSYMYAVYKEKSSRESSPFNQYEFRNITALLRVNYNGQLNGWANLYAGSKQNYTKVSYIGNTASHFVMFTDSTYSYAEHKYDSSSEVLDLKLYGGAQTNSIKLAVNIGFSVTMNTTDYYFPISWRINMTLKKNAKQTSNAVFNMPQKFKILPGGVLTVDENVELRVDTLSVYEEYTDTVSGLAPYGDGKTLSRAKLIIKGIVTASNLAGIVDADGTRGQLIVTGNTSIVTYETDGAVSGSSLKASIGFKQITNTLKLRKYENGIVATEATAVGSGTYVSKNDGWRAPNFSITVENICDESLDLGTITNNNPTSFTNTSIISLLMLSSSNEALEFVAWYTDEACTNEISVIDGSAILDDIVLYAKWIESTTKKYSVYYNYYTGEGLLENATIQTKEVRIEENTYLELSALSSLPVEKAGYTFNYWTYNGNKVESDILITANITLIANYTINSYTVTFDSKGGSAVDSQTIQYYGTATKPTPTRDGYTFNEWYIDSTDSTEAIVFDFSTKITGDIKLYATWTSCIAAGTLITLADGTKKAVEDITLDDKLLVFNHETGSYDFANIIFIDDDGWKTYEIINLVFSDGTITKIIYEHGFYDLDLMKYVYVNKSTMNDYIGHRFYKGDYDGVNYISSEIVLVDVYVTYEYTGCYSPVTVYHLNYFTDNLLSMPGGIDGLFNIFEYDDNLQYNQELMQKDIETYGLFDYEIIAEYVSYETYCVFPTKYFSVSIGKGYMTMEELLALIEKYKDKF